MRDDFNKWLNKKIPYSNLLNIHFILKIFIRLRQWIDNNNELDRFIDNNELFNKFSLFLYNEYVKTNKYSNINFDMDDIYDAYTSKYTEDVSILYRYFKDYAKSLNIDIFNNKNNNSYPLLEFIYSVCDFDNYNDSDLENENDSNEELYIENNY